MAYVPSQRDKKVIAVAAVFLLGAAGDYMYVYKPKAADLAIKTALTDSVEALNEIAKTLVARGNAAQTRAEADLFAKQLTTLRRLVPTATEVPGLLESISSSARRVGLEVADVAPDGIISGDQFDTYRFKLAVIGPYHRIAEFFTNVASLERIVAPMNVVLGITTRTTERKPGKDEVFLEARFQVQTYVAKASVPGSGNER